MKMKSLLGVGLFAAVVAPGLPALADAYAQQYNTFFPAGTTELWVDTNTPTGSAAIAAGYADQYQEYGYDSSGNFLGRVYTEESRVSGNYKLEYWGDIYIYDTGSGLNSSHYVDLGAATTNTAVTYDLRTYPDSNYFGGHKIDAIIIVGSNTLDTLYFPLATSVGTSFGQANVTDYFQGCNYNNSNNHSFSSANYKNSSGQWVAYWPSGTLDRLQNDSTCLTTAGATGNLSTGTVTLSVTH